MPDLKIKQLRFETETWKRLLAFMLDENVHLKNRLSEILKDKFDGYLLEEVDNYLNTFIKEDEMIGLLRNEVAEIDQLITKEIPEKEEVISEVERKLKKLRANIIIAEKQFGKIKSDFNCYLSENIPSM